MMEHLRHFSILLGSRPVDKDAFKAHALKYKNELSPVINKNMDVHRPCFLVRELCYRRHGDELHDLLEFLINEFPNINFSRNIVSSCLACENYQCALIMAKQPGYDICELLNSHIDNKTPTHILECIFAIAQPMSASDKLLTQPSFVDDARMRIHEDKSSSPAFVQLYLRNPEQVRYKLRIKHKMPCPELSARVFIFCLLLENKDFQIVV